jgi:hypothetical protein
VIRNDRVPAINVILGDSPATSSAQRIPTALIYLGFLGDKEISNDPLRDHDHWRKTVIENTQEIFPRMLWEKPIDINGTPLSFLIRSLPYIRQSPVQRSR